MIPIARPELGEAEAEAARRTVLSGWVTQGPEVAAFEREFAAAVGAEHACAVANCTVALQLALIGLGIGSGDEVITVSHSFIATANAVRHSGAEPVFVDVLPGTYNIDPTAILDAIGPRTRAILCVHQMGMPCDMATILPLAHAHGLRVIEDAACAAGSEIEWRGHWQRIGRPHGDVACFSFHPRKVVTTGDGGMLTTSDPELDRQFRLRRQHGMSISDTTRHQSPQVLFETYPIVGFNYRLTDIQAAIGRQQLARLPLLVDQRRQLARGYMARVGAIADLTLPVEPAWARSNWQSYCVRLPPGVDQRRVMQAMLNHGIATRRGIMCAHREPAYRDTPSRHRLTVSEAAQDHCILLPLYAGMSVGDQDIVVDALAAALQAERASRDSTRMLATT